MDRESPKLLVVAGGGLTASLAQYALKVAVRLTLEIIVLFVDEDVSWTDTRQHRSKVECFKTKVEAEAAEFSTLAWKSSVNVTTIVDVNSRESAIAQVRALEPGIRFILSDTLNDPENKGTGQNGYPKLTVIRPV
jgi:hypothetical protein